MADAIFTQVLQKASNHFLLWDKVRDIRDAYNNPSYYILIFLRECINSIRWAAISSSKTISFTIISKILGFIFQCRIQT